MFLYTYISQNTIIVHSYEYGIYCIISTIKKNSRCLHYSFGCLIFGYFCLTSTLFFAFFSLTHRIYTQLMYFALYTHHGVMKVRLGYHRVRGN